MGKQSRSDRGVVLDQVAFGISVVGKEDLVDVGKPDRAINLQRVVAISVLLHMDRGREVDIRRRKGTPLNLIRRAVVGLDLLPDASMTLHVSGL